MTLIAKLRVASTRNVQSIPILTHAAIILLEILLTAPTTMVLGAFPPVMAEYFPTKYRYSGSGLTFQFNGLYADIIIGFVIPPIIALVGGPLNALLPVAAVIFGMMLLSLIITLVLLKETKGVAIE